MRKFFASATLRLGVVLALLASTVAGQQLIRQPTSAPILNTDAQSAVVRSRRVEIDFTLIGSAQARQLQQQFQRGTADRTLELNLFEGKSVRVRLHNATASADGTTWIWNGNVEGTKYGEIILAISGDVMSANISTDSATRYQIRSDTAGYWVHEIDATRFPAEREANAAPGRLPDSSTVRLALLYTTAARQKAGGAAAMNNLIELTIAELNHGLSNSRILRRVQLVHREEVSTVETSPGQSGIIDRVTVASNANVVGFLVDNPTSCGTNAVSGPAPLFAVDYRCASGNYSLARELGRFLGFADGDGGFLARPLYSFLQDPAPNPVSTVLRTIMARSCPNGTNCPRANYWTNAGELEIIQHPDGAVNRVEPSGDRLTPIDGCPVTPITSNAEVIGSLTTASCRSPRRTNAYASQYSFAGVAGERIIIRLAPAPASSFDTYLFLLGGGDAVLASNDDYGGTLDSRIPTADGAVFTLPATGTYVIEATTFRQNITGNFTLSLIKDPPLLTSPAPGSSLRGVSETFTWTPGSASQYHLCVGTTRQLCDIYNQFLGSNLSVPVTGLPLNGSQVYVKLWGLFGGVWQYSDYTYAACCELPRMIAPPPDSTLPPGPVTFSWTAGAASQFHLCVGTASPCNGNIFDQNVGSSVSATIPGIPQNGRDVYVKLWGLTLGGWRFTEYTYTAAGRPQMISPAPRSTLPASPVTFSWNPGTGTQYHIYVGTLGQGSKDIFDRNVGANLSVTVPAIPQCGTGSIYVRLWGLIEGVWLFTDYTYSRFCDRPQLTSPPPGSTLPDAVVTFSWTAGSATQYHLCVGTGSVGSCSIFNQNTGTSRSVLVRGLPTNGEAVYVRLWGLILGQWQFLDDVFTACSNCALPRITSPTNPVLPDAVVTFSWTFGSATQYHLCVGTGGTGSCNIFNQNTGTNTSATVTGLPTNGETVFLRLWALVGGVWVFRDYVFTACSNCAIPTITSPPNANPVLPDGVVSFYWTFGSATQYHFCVGTGGTGSCNIFNQNTGTNTSATVTGLPTNGETVFVRLWGLVGGVWRFRDVTFTACSNCAMPQITNPSPGSTVSGPTVTFCWTYGAATQYHLTVGTLGVGSGNIFNQNMGMNRCSSTIGGLPASGILYVRLWGLVSGSWQLREHTFSKIP